MNGVAYVLIDLATVGVASAPARDTGEATRCYKPPAGQEARARRNLDSYLIAIRTERVMDTPHVLRVRIRLRCMSVIMSFVAMVMPVVVIMMCVTVSGTVVMVGV